MNGPGTALVGVVVLFLVAACAGPGASVSPSATTSASIAPSPPPATRSPSPAATEAPEEPAPPSGACAPGTVCDGPLEPGTYTSTALGSPITFEIGAGWNGFPDLPDVGFALLRQDLGNAVGLTVTWFPGKVFEQTCPDEPTTADLEPGAQAFVEWLATHAALDATEPQEVTVGGMSGWAVDVRASVPAACTAPPWVLLWELPTVGDFHLADDEQARFVAIDAPDRTLVIVLESYPGADHAAAIALLEPILESMVIAEGP